MYPGWVGGTALWKALKAAIQSRLDASAYSHLHNKGVGGTYEQGFLHPSVIDFGLPKHTVLLNLRHRVAVSVAKRTRVIDVRARATAIYGLAQTLQGRWGSFH